MTFIKQKDEKVKETTRGKKQRRTADHRKDCLQVGNLFGFLSAAKIKIAYVVNICQSVNVYSFTRFYFVFSLCSF